MQIGVRYQPLSKSTGLTLGNDISGSTGSHFESPVPSTHDRDSIGVKWNAHDENDDQLTYSVYYKGDGETRWLLLKDNLSDKAYSFDASLIPDGGYTIKVIASDSPSHSPGDALSVLGKADASKSIRLLRELRILRRRSRMDRFMCIFRAGRIFIHQARGIFRRCRRLEIRGAYRPTSDSRNGEYDFKVALGDRERCSHRTDVVVRVYDKYDNMGTPRSGDRLQPTA